jgi:adenosine deaminase
VSNGEQATLDPQIDRLIRTIPKVELHVHLEGSIPPALALALATRHGVELPGAGGGVEGLKARYRYSDFQAFIDLYVAISSCLCTVDDFADVVKAVAAELSRQHVRYAEVTFTPMTHVDRGVPIDVILNGLEEGRAAARDEHGVRIAWVFDIIRTLPDHAEPTLDIAKQGQAQGVVGLGLAGPEGRPHDMDGFADVFARGRAAGLVALPHAGEMAGPESIWSAIKTLGATRIGHGVRCLEDPELVAFLRQRQIPLEVCPASNVALGVVENLASHPLPRLLHHGLAVSLASDDPPLFGTTLTDEYLRCAACFGWDAQQVVGLVRAAVDHACIDDSLRRALHDEQAGLAADLASN